MKQHRPKNLVEAVSFTIEMELYFLHPSKLAPVMPDESHPLVSAVQSQQGAMLQVLEGITQQLHRLEVSVREQSHSPWSSRPPNQPKVQQSRDRSPVICHKCKQEGHYARGCTYHGTSSGN